MSDVPLGMFLSGGLDSSAIAALMARMIDRPLQTFSVAFKAARVQRAGLRARRCRDAIGADAHEIVIDDRDFFGALPRLVWHEDEPIAHPSSVPLYFVSKLAREHVKVVLTGEGSDELLAGYGKYPRALLNWRAGAVYARVGAASRFAPASPARRPAGCRGASAATRSDRSSRRRARRRTLMFFDNFAGDRPVAAAASCSSPRLRALVDARAAPTAPSLAYFDRAATAAAPTARPAALRRPEDLPGRAADEAGPDEHGGVDREPRAVPRSPAGRVRRRAARRIASSRGFTTKRILREAVNDVLPPSILTPPEDGIPGAVRHLDARRLARRRPRRAARSPHARARHRLDAGGERRRGCLDAHRAGRRRTDGGDAVWSLLNLELWYRTFIDGDGVQTLAAPRAATADAAMPLERQPVQPVSGVVTAMSILWLNAGLLLPLDKGGKLRTWHLMRHLARAPRHHVPLVRGSDAAEARPRGHARGLRRARHDRRGATRRRAACASTPTPRAICSIRCRTRWRKYRSRALPARRARRCSRSGGFDRVVCDFLVPAVNLPARLPCPRCSSRTTSRPRSGGGTPRRRRIRLRKRLLPDAVAADAALRGPDGGALRPACSRCPTPTRHAAAALSATAAAARVTSCRPASTPSTSRPRRSDRATAAHGLHGLDGLAAERGRDDVLLPRHPAAHPRARSPTSRSAIVGRAPTPAVRRLAEDRGIEVTGRVDDVRPYIARGAVYIVPLRIGGGTRLKIFEAMAMGKAVVSTTVGAEGLPVEHGRGPAARRRRRRRSPRAVVALLRDADARATHRAREARALVVERYDWSAVGAAARSMRLPTRRTRGASADPHGSAFP